MTTTANTTAADAADAIAAETAETAVAGESTLDEATRIACDLATSEAVDATAAAIAIRGSWRDLNAKGNGSESYRRAMSPGRPWRFVASSRLPSKTFLASDRRTTIRGDVFPGDLLADYERRLHAGQSTSEAVHDGQIGLVVGPSDDGADIVWMDAVRQKDGTLRVILPTGAHLTVATPGWR